MQENNQAKQPEKQTEPRRINIIALFVVLVVGLVIYNHKPAIPHVYCNDEILKSRPEVILLGTWWCPSCYEARRYLSENQISYCEYDIERSTKGEQMFKDVNGRVIPVLLIGDYMMSGFDEVRLERLLDKARGN